ncbi:MAG TPA: hypothetical protein VLC11_03410 [Gemmatimonadales bacterium]|nr:hypothetical protein [Gemmatimonadales bacterium]
MRYVRPIVVLMVAFLVNSRPAHAQVSCEGPNGCSLQMSVNAMVLSTRIPSVARVAVRTAGQAGQAQVDTRSNTGWSLSVSRGGAAGEPVQVRSPTSGGTVTPIETRRGGVVIVTLAER